MKQHDRYTVAIVGAGSGGISVAARLVRQCKELRGKVVLIDPASHHYYQPLWTLVGAGVVNKQQTERPQQSLIPRGVTWLQEAVYEFYPEERYVLTEKGTQVHYDCLVVAAGIQVNWDQIKGLRQAIGRDGVCSNYAYEHVDSTWKAIQSFKGGNAIFTLPNTPVKCGGAPQKIMYLADDHFRKAGVRDRSDVIFASAGTAIFAVKKYADALQQVIARKSITARYRRDLVEIRKDTKEAVFEHLDTKEQEIIPYDMIHVVPPMSAPDFIKRSLLADEAGWVDVDKFTLQHKRYPTVFALGDCSNLPTSKTGAAIRKQAPVVANNLVSFLAGKPLQGSYDGYTSCPLVTGYNRLVLAEFDYDLEPRETFPFNQAKERYSMYVLKKQMLPFMYWHGMLKGRL
ncbi:FAD/NAD(P)-binding oxidoreductase [Paenibacillus sp. 481]|uniref:FAD/NAD(P)-binding oxidoreductase n=1 Tax=Paenibacillus sp. 481 TaxID=2835869 RepID=UPI001E3C9873|nr:FAD/NAD(P)-binding oxidoreductase [Paenibacillus sp. 481]UHA76008.1 NAD(P)/FAD-dependent oxidoreductase [Paenibacillus sp. 481]